MNIFQILHSIIVFVITAEDEQSAESESCGKALIVLSWILVIITMPFSLFVCFKVSSIFSINFSDAFKFFWMVENEQRWYINVINNKLTKIWQSKYWCDWIKKKSTIDNNFNRFGQTVNCYGVRLYSIKEA